MLLRVRRSRRGSLLEKFEQLLDSEQAQKRGYSFEVLLSELLRSSGFRVHRNPKTARPRQTDLIAECGSTFFLIETKWKKKALGSNDIDDLRKRLERVSPDVIGCIFSVSDFSKPALDEVVRDRTREILLFNSREIYMMFSSRISFWALVEKKKNQLRTHASVWFEPTVPGKTGTDEVVKMMPPPSIFVGKAGDTTPWATKSRDRVELVFAHDLPYVDNSLGGNCVGFQVSLDAASIGDLQYALGLASRHFGLSGNTSYSIHQVPYAWHGFGMQSFLEALGSWRERYSGVGLQSYHHSEELAFFGQLEPGMFCLNARQRVSDDPFIHGAEIQIYLPGVPVDTQPFQAFCRDLDRWAGHFETLARSNTETINFYERIPLEPSSLIISVDEVNESISGAVVKNPFCRNRFNFKSTHPLAMKVIGQEELLFCAFQDWLPSTFKPGPLVLLRLEATWVGQSPVLRPVCTWEISTERKSAAPTQKDRQTKAFEEKSVKILRSLEIAERC